MTLRTLILCAALAASGCISYQPHGWTRSQVRAPGIQQLSSEKLSAVRTEEVREAVRLLEHVDSVLLDDASVKRFARHRIRKSPGESVFLVRGVSWSAPPLFREVYFDNATRTIYVDSYTYNGEIFIPGRRLSAPSPIIVFLDVAPSAVVPTATLGGDRVAAWSLRKQAWHEDQD